MEDGMAEAQAQAAGCLRLLSLSDLAKVDVMAAGAVRFLTPLLESKLHHARWNARQVTHASLEMHASEDAAHRSLSPASWQHLVEQTLLLITRHHIQLQAVTTPCTDDLVHTKRCLSLVTDDDPHTPCILPWLS